MLEQNSNCRLCEKYKTEGSVIFETENFWVAPALGQIVEGYLLICTKKCFIGLSEIPRKLFGELENVQSKVRDILAKYYVKPIFFEHGIVASHKKGGCCIDHTHLHAVPFAADLLKDIAKHFKPVKITKLSSLKTQYKKQIPYLFYENNDGKRYLFELFKPIPSQYFRRLLAAETGNPKEFNWKQYPEIYKFNQTLEKLRGKF